LKTEVNSKIVPALGRAIWDQHASAVSRGSNRNSRLQKKVQIYQEVDPALRLAGSENGFLLRSKWKMTPTSKGELRARLAQSAATGAVL
jgi:hypothetical protein